MSDPNQLMAPTTLFGNFALSYKQITAAYSLISSDNGTALYVNSATPVTLTVPNNLGQGFNCLIIQEGAGRVTVAAGAGVTINNNGGNSKTAAQYAAVSLLTRDGSVFYLAGDTAA